MSMLFFFSFLTMGALEYTILPDDTLYSISRRYGVAVSWIMEENNLSSESIRVGERLKLPDIDRHRVENGENLSRIARRYKKSVTEIRRLNGLTGDVIHPGQVLYLREKRPDSHRVQKGDSLWSIASNYDVNVRDILAWNAMDSESIRVGENIRLYPTVEEKALERAHVGNEKEIKTALASLTPFLPVAADVSQDRSVTQRKALPQDGEYFFSSPEKEKQPNVVYWEGADSDIREGFRRASRILGEYDASISQMGSLSRDLEGWHIVLDPGHGGLDPGAIVQVQDGNGNSLAITEDEYVYDIAIRLYRILKRHGASVSMTTLATDHHVRDGQTAQRTFVNRKNEIYNDKVHNFSKGWRPVGTVEGLDLRKTVAAKQVQNVPPQAKKQGTLFLSIHADNSPNLPSGMAVLYDGSDEKELEASRNLASGLVKYMGGRTFMKQQKLRVLNNNPMQAGVLIEVRNIHYKSNAWALRSFRMREEDAQKIAKGVLGWVRG